MSGLPNLLINSEYGNFAQTYRFNVNSKNFTIKSLLNIHMMGKYQSKGGKEMIQSGILEKVTQSLDDLYRLVEQHADSNIFIHEVSNNKKNLLKTMRELYTEHNNYLRNNQTLEETIDSLRKQLTEKEKALKTMPTEDSITKHFNDLDSRAAALESKLEEKIKDPSPLLQSLQKQMKQMDEEVKKVSGSMEELNEADSCKDAQIIQINEATQNLQERIDRKSVV